MCGWECIWPIHKILLEPFQKKTFWDSNCGLLFFSPYMGENLKGKEKYLWIVQYFVYKIILKSHAERVGNGKRGNPLAAVCPHAWLHFTHPHWSLWRPWPLPRPSPGIFYLLPWLFALSASPHTCLVAASSVVTPKMCRGAKEHRVSPYFYLGFKYPKNNV